MGTVNSANMYLQNAMAIMPKDKAAFKNRLASYDANKDGKITKTELDNVMNTRRQGVVDDIASYERYNGLKTKLANIKKLFPKFGKFVDVIANLVTLKLNNIESGLQNHAEEYAVGKVVQDQFGKFAGALNGGNGAAVDLGADLDALASEDGVGDKLSAVDLDLVGSKTVSQNRQDWNNAFQAADGNQDNTLSKLEVTNQVNAKKAELDTALANADVAKIRSLRGELGILNAFQADHEVFAGVSVNDDPLSFTAADLDEMAGKDGNQANLTGEELFREKRGSIEADKYIGALARFDDINGTAPTKAQLLSYVDQAPQVSQLLADFAKDSPEFATSVNGQIRNVLDDVKMAKRLSQHFNLFDTNGNGRIEAAEIDAKKDAGGLVTDAKLGVTNPFGGI